MRDSLSPIDCSRKLSTAFAVLATLLAAVVLYGVMSTPCPRLRRWGRQWRFAPTSDGHRMVLPIFRDGRIGM